MIFFLSHQVPKNSTVGDIVVVDGVRYVLIKKIKNGWCVQYA